MAGAIRVGDTIRDRDTLRAVPTGTAIAEVRNEQSTWTKDAEGLWINQSGGRWTEHDFQMGAMKILAFPNEVAEYTAPIKTLEQVKWEYRNGALAAAVSHGVSMSAVERSLDRMGAGAQDMEQMIGTGVTIGDNNTRDSLPNGSVIFHGLPESPNSLAVFVKRRGRWEHVLGERNWLDGSVVVDSVAGVRERPAWLDRQGTEEDEQAIREFKATAWRVGYDLKREMGWCGTYEDIVRRLGVTEAAIRVAERGGYTVGMRLHFDAVHDLPVGSVLVWQHQSNPDLWAVFLRSANASNRAMTVRVAASADQAARDHEQQKRYMVIVALPDRGSTTATWDVPEYMNSQFLAQFPAGTRFSYGGEGANNGTFIIAADHIAANDSTVIPPRGQWFTSAFGRTPQFTVRSLP